MIESSAQHHVELDDQALTLIEALRAEDEIPAEIHDRVWDRIDRDIAQRRARSVGGWVAGGLAVAAALALVWIGGRTLSEDSSESSNMQAPFEVAEQENEHTAASRRPSTSKPRSDIDAISPPEQEPPAQPLDKSEGPDDLSPREGRSVAPEPVSAPTAHGTRPRSRTATRTHRDGDDDIDGDAGADPLSQEMALLKRAKLALSGGEARRALRLLDEHAQRFSQGVLAQERQALRVVALCDAGDLARGREEAKRFLQEHPRAALAERVRAACPR
jgi:hypothetical protein